MKRFIGFFPILLCLFSGVLFPLFSQENQQGTQSANLENQIQFSNEILTDYKTIPPSLDISTMSLTDLIGNALNDSLKLENLVIQLTKDWKASKEQIVQLQSISEKSQDVLKKMEPLIQKDAELLAQDKHLIDLSLQEIIRLESIQSKQKRTQKIRVVINDVIWVTSISSALSLGYGLAEDDSSMVKYGVVGCCIGFVSLLVDNYFTFH